MRHNILVFILAFLVVSATLAGACGQDDEQVIKDTMTGFLTAYNDEDFNLCLDYVSDGLRSSKGDEQVIADLKEGKAASGNAILESMGKLEIDGKSAKISVSFSGFMGQVNTVRFPLIKESGSWKING
ncbi:hypothetical protein ACFLVE_01090 [Chloroflexota bacterium]